MDYQKEKVNIFSSLHLAEFKKDVVKTCLSASLLPGGTLSLKYQTLLLVRRLNKRA